MKKTKIFVFGALALMAANFSAKAQYYWSGSTTLTTTTGGLIDMTVPLDPAGAWRILQGGTVQGGLAMIANTSGTDGPAISLHGTGYPSSDGRAGSILYLNKGSVGYGHRFMNFDGSAFHTNLSIGNDGHVIAGADVDHSFIAPGDNFTVRDQLGLWPSWTSAGNVSMHGNTAVGSLSLNANTDVTNGSSILLHGGSIGGWTRYISSGGFSAGMGHQFSSTDGSGLIQDNAIIGNDGRMMVGKDVSFSFAVPGDVLTVRDQIGLWPSGPSLGVTRINGNTPSGAFLLNGNTSQSDGPSIGMYGAPGGGEIKYISHDHGGGVGKGHEFLSDISGTHNSLMTIYNSGKVAIGSSLMTWPPVGSPDMVHPDGYLLFVEKGILTEKLKVALIGDVTNWSDYVFNKDYNLMPLNEVEEYVQEHKHLPEIPSATEVKENGIDVAVMDAKLLQKIEELTLYVIQQQKEINELKKNRR